MRIILFIISLLFFIGCSTKVDNKYPSYQMQQNNANTEWKNLDKEEK